MILEIENKNLIMLEVHFSSLKDRDGEEIKLNHVYVGHSNGRMDILNALSSAEKEAIAEECLGYAE